MVIMQVLLLQGNSFSLLVLGRKDLLRLGLFVRSDIATDQVLSRS